MTERQLQYYEYLLGIMLKTRAARFGAAATLQMKERISVSVVAFLSIYLLAWSVASLSYPELFTPEHSRFFTTVSAVSAAAVLAITLMDQSFSRAVRAEKFHTNALQISQLMRELERELIEPNPDFSKMAQIASTYEQYISQTAINHSQMDYTKSQLARKNSDHLFEGAFYKLRSILYNAWFYMSSMFVYLFVVAAVVVITAWYSWNFVFSL